MDNQLIKSSLNGLSEKNHMVEEPFQKTLTGQNTLLPV